MIQLPALTTKFLIVLLLGTLFFHISFDKSKKYSFVYDGDVIEHATYDEYLVCLNSLSDLEKETFIESTDIIYLNGYKEFTYYIIYAIYFTVFSLLVLIAKYKPVLNEN